MSPRLTDWSLALVSSLALITGLVSLVSGLPQEWLIFALHGAVGLWLVLLVWEKVRRIWPRLLSWRRWDQRTLYGVLALFVVVLTLAAGIYWVIGGDVVFAGFNLLNWHIALGLVVSLAIIAHMFARAKRLRKRDILGRRQALHWGGLLLTSAFVWPVQQVVQQKLHTPGATRRFTGSREANSFEGNIFPTSSWVADQPRPLQSETWRLSVGGAVHAPRSFSYEELVLVGDTLEATLDCTGGFYSTQHWQGMSVGRLLDVVKPRTNAVAVSFVSVTSYRWSLPIEEARSALVATHVGDEPLSYEHGFPLRLVAPGRRGFQWVKWITHIEVLTAPDPGEYVSIFTSSFMPEG